MYFWHDTTGGGYHLRLEASRRRNDAHVHYSSPTAANRAWRWHGRVWRSRLFVRPHAGADLNYRRSCRICQRWNHSLHEKILQTILFLIGIYKKFVPPPVQKRTDGKTSKIKQVTWFSFNSLVLHCHATIVNRRFIWINFKLHEIYLAHWRFCQFRLICGCVCREWTHFSFCAFVVEERHMHVNWKTRDHPNALLKEGLIEFKRKLTR